MGDIMNLEQLADYLQMSQASVYHLVAASRIPGSKVGRQWRFSKAAIDKWLQNTVTTSACSLVVEDDPLVRKLIVQALRDSGHQATDADTIADAKRLLQEFQYDIIFLDMLLPDGTGLDVVNAVLMLPTLPDVVITTAHPDHDSVEEIRRLLPQITVLRKPVKLSALIEHASHAATAGAATVRRPVMN